MGAVVLDGAIIRAGAMVGAGALVTPGKDLDGGYLYVCSPARCLSELTETEKKFLGYSADQFVRLKNRWMA